MRLISVFFRNFAVAIMETTPQQRRNRFNTVIDPDIVERVKQLVLGSRNTVITCHVSPDGDALGSSLALCSTLRSLGKTQWWSQPTVRPRPCSSCRAYVTS